MRISEWIAIALVIGALAVATYEINEASKRPQPKPQPPIVVYLVTPQQAAQIEIGELPEYGKGRIGR